VSDSETLTSQWGDYTTVHQQVRQLDDNGQWDKAVALSTDPSAKGSDGTFTTFDTAVTQARDQAGKAAIERLDGLARTAPIAAIAVALAALIAAWLVVRGIGQRMEEYR
jgi:hypothetical protein